MNPLFLGGWRHVAEDVRRLTKGLSALPDACTCGRVGNGCPDCEAQLGSIRDDVDELVDAALRFLPFVESQAVVAGDTRGSEGVRDLRRRVWSVAEVADRSGTEAGECRTGCGASHAEGIRALASELAAATTALDALLTMTSARATPSRVAGA
ncbi:MAG: hypothetical protein AMXMBFR57_24800 [Acidimicrobiia bacterium]|jgi:hypothetical protein